MKKRIIALGLVALAALFAWSSLREAGTTPPGQKPLIILSSSDLSQFQGAFDADADAPRLVLLLSPT
jgi:hypothetical protein